MKIFISSIALLLLLTNCNIYHVLYTDKDMTTDFTKYRSFAWLPQHTLKDSTPFHNQIIENNTKNYLSHEFMARGLKIHVDTPDVLLQLDIKSLNKHKLEQVEHTTPETYHYQYNATSPVNPYYTPYPSYFTYSNVHMHNAARFRFSTNSMNNANYTTQVVNYEESTITLNMIDRKTEKLVWTVVVEGDLYDPKQMENYIHKAVIKMAKDYPIKPFHTKKKNCCSKRSKVVCVSR